MRIDFLVFILSAFLSLTVPGIARAADGTDTGKQPVDQRLKALIEETKAMQKTNAKPSQDYLDRAVGTALDIKAKADARAREVEANIRAMENGEEPPYPGKIPPQLLQEYTDNAAELLKSGNYEAARDLAQQVLEQDPDSAEAKSIFEKAKAGLK